MNKSDKAIRQTYCVYNPFIDMFKNLLAAFVKTNFSHSEIRDESRF